jgi:hypothetical protein
MNIALDMNIGDQYELLSNLYISWSIKRRKILALNKKSFQLGSLLSGKTFLLFLMFKRKSFISFVSRCVTITIYSQSSSPAVQLSHTLSLFFSSYAVCEYKVRHSEWEVQAAIFKWYFVCEWKLIFWGGRGGGGYWKCVYCTEGVSEWEREREIQNEYLAKSISPTGL